MPYRSPNIGPARFSGASLKKNRTRIRRKKVNRIRDQLVKGLYTIDAMRVAQALLD